MTRSSNRVSAQDLMKHACFQRPIDYLKFDIEFSEWAAIVAMLEEGCLDKVKQLSFEGHAWGDTDSNYTLFWEGMHGLENSGFFKWRVSNRHWRCFHPTDAPSETWCPQADINYINAKYLNKWWLFSNIPFHNCHMEVVFRLSWWNLVLLWWCTVGIKE